MSDHPYVDAQLLELAYSGDLARFLARAKDLPPPDLSDVLAALEPDLRLRLVQALPVEVVSEAIAEMEQEEHPEDLLAALRPEQAADIVEELEDDDAVDLIADLPPDKAARILSSVANRADIERLLHYDEESAGGLMTAQLVAVQETASAAEAIEEVRRQASEIGEFYNVFCVDRRLHLVGVLPLQKMVVAQPETVVRDIMEPVPAVLTPDLDQEEVARLIARYNVPALPVVDDRGRLLGRVTFDDVIDVVEAEQTEDLLRFGGVAADEELGGTWWESVRSRLPWLYVNTITAFLAAAVVYLFQDAIGSLVVLAVFMPIVAGQGGNAGTQALAVTVRRLALHQIRQSHAGRVIVKEVVVGATNGLAVGLAVGLVAAVVGATPMLGLVVAAAMWGNLMIAGFVGSVVPILLERLGVDPAVASSVFVTPVTDACGFLLLLGLASAVLL